MCRAVWVIVVARDDETAKKLRLALGPEVQVVLMTTNPADANIRTTTADVLVIDGELPGARELVEDMAQTPLSILWVGEDAPEHANHATAEGDDLERGVMKALINRRS